MGNTVTIECAECAECGSKFEKEKKEYTRQRKRGRDKLFCSLRCSGIYYGKFPETKAREESRKENFRLGNLNRKEELSPYKEHLRRAKRRSPKGSVNLTALYLKELFEKQNGTCIYSGVKLTLEDNSDHVYAASLDRIDSNKGYEIGNVQWCSVTMNFAKQSMSHENTLKFINEIRRHSN